MPWRAVDTMDLRREFVTLARTETIPVRELCRRFGFSPKTDYTWLNRHARGGALTRLGAWLARLDIQVWHGLPCHPQPQGKVERFHQTVTAEVLRPGGLPGLAHCQAAFDAWRPVYNHERPHQVLGDTRPVAINPAHGRSPPCGRRSSMALTIWCAGCIAPGRSCCTATPSTSPRRCVGKRWRCGPPAAMASTQSLTVAITSAPSTSANQRTPR
jgi:hypothetical protein